MFVGSHLGSLSFLPLPSSQPSPLPPRYRYESSLLVSARLKPLPFLFVPVCSTLSVTTCTYPSEDKPVERISTSCSIYVSSVAKTPPLSATQCNDHLEVIYPSSCSTYCTYQQERDNTPPSTVLFPSSSPLATVTFTHGNSPFPPHPPPPSFLNNFATADLFFFFRTYSTGKRIYMPPPATFL